MAEGINGVAMPFLCRKAVQCVFPAAGLVVVLAAMLPMRANGMAPLRPWSLASLRTEFGFTTDCMKTLRKMEEEPDEDDDNPLAEAVEDQVDKVPFVSDLIDLYQRFFGKDKHEDVPEYELEGASDLSAFPKNGCIVHDGRVAMCRKQLNVKKGGFEWKADVGFLVKYKATTWVDARDEYNPEPPFEFVRPNCTHTLFVDCFKKWKGVVPARRPAMTFALQRAMPERKEGDPPLTKAQILKLPMQCIPVRADAKPPMELAVRFDDVELSPTEMKAKMRFECKANGVSIYNATLGKFRVDTC